MRVPHALHLTVLPRASTGTASTLRQTRLGHMIRMVSSLMLSPFGGSPRLPIDLTATPLH